MSKLVSSPKLLIFAPLLLLLMLAVACGADATPTPVVIEKEVIKEVIKEVEVTVVATPTPRPAPAKVVPKVEMLQIMIPSPFIETNTTWKAQASENSLGTRHMTNTLLEVDAFSSAVVPGLATEYEMLTPDAKNWRIKLRKGIQFHDGWGEFTARDVTHSIALLTQTDIVETASQQRLSRLFGETEPIPDDVIDYESPVFDNIEIVNDHELIFHNLAAQADMDFVLVSRNGSLFMFSRAYWDAEGIPGYSEKVIGTGSWKYAKRELTLYQEMEAVQDHWLKTPGFPRIRINFGRENTTRLAALLAGEVQIAVLPRDLYQQAKSAGMVVYSSTGPSHFALVGFGGFYRADHDYYKPDVAWLDKRIRQAINHAINRDEIIEEIFGGDALKMLVGGYHPVLEGWNPDWPKNFEKDYGYDPERAKELIAEAGYAPGEIKVQSLVSTLSRLPEMPALGEALAGYLNAVGIKTALLELEFSAFVPFFREDKMHNIISVLPATFLPPIETLRAFNWSEGTLAFSETEFIDENYPKYRNSVDQVEREDLLLAMGNHKYDEYLDAPLVWLSAQLMVDPSIVASVTFPGGMIGSYGEWAYVEPVPK